MTDIDDNDDENNDGDDEEPTIAYAFSEVSGTDPVGFHCIVVRYDEHYGFKPPYGDSSVFMLRSDGIVQARLHSPGWLTGVWQSDAGRVFTTEIDGQVSRAESGPDTDWVTENLGATLTGIWGLSDDYVFAWGLGDETKPAMFLWDGRAWKSIPAPGEVVRVHGIRRDLVIAVGYQGLIARWDGTSWTRFGTGQFGTLSHIFVESDDEMYACGPSRDFFVGSANGWTRALVAPNQLSGVAKWRGAVWVASLGPEGLCKFENGQLVTVKDNIRALHIDARKTLLMCTLDLIVWTDDGQEFAGVHVDDFGEVIANRPPSWR